MSSHPEVPRLADRQHPPAMNRELAVGTNLAGYRIVRLIGRGGTGLVYEAEHLVLGRSAAVKTLVPTLVDDAEFRERLLRESRTVAALEHPTVIPIYDAGEVDGILYVAMRLVRGPDLAGLVDQRGTLDLETTLGVLEQVAGALDAAHASGLVHRDVKPANVLLEEATGRVYLSDFGIAKHAESAGLTRTGFFLGTIDSAAPEQIQGQQVGPPADVYAFGCTIYECLAGRPPYDRNTTAAVLRAHISDPPPALPRELGLPVGLDDVIARALAKEPDGRYATCGDLVDDFRRASGIGGQTRAWTALQPTLPRAAGASALPAETTPLFGRELELGRLDSLLRQPDVRLVTLTGLGGTGKTRLAIAAARAASDDFDDVAFVDLSTICDPDDLPLVLGQALEVAVSDDDMAVEAIAEHIAGRRTLLVLDSAERTLASAPLLGDLLAASPRLVLLVTSQIALRLREEQRVPVPPLPLPTPDVTDVAQLATVPPVALFVDRARTVKPEFELAGENAATVVAICARLDGLPLAIELAAARISLLPPQGILARLDQRLAFLTDGARGLPDRQQTLRGAIDWTYTLLAERERVLFARLGVFAGGWSLEAAESICGDPARSGVGELLNSLAVLVDNSLVRQHEGGGGGEPRFTMLDTIREYALERLRERAEHDEISRRHADRYLALAENAQPELEGPGQLAWMGRLSEEEDNIAAALAWSLSEGGDLQTGLRIAAALTRFWVMQGRTVAARRWLEQALAVGGDAGGPPVARAHYAAGYAALCEGDLGPANEHLEEGARRSGSTGDTATEASALALLAAVLLQRGEAHAARETADRALAVLGPDGNKAAASAALTVLADVAAYEGDAANAAAHADAASRLRRELGDRSLLASSLIATARRDVAHRETAETTALLTEGLDLARAVGDVWAESTALAGLGAVAALEGDLTTGRRLLSEGLELARRRGDRRTVAECVHGLAVVAALDGDTHRAARLLGAAGALRDETGARLSTIELALDRLAEPRLAEVTGGVFEVERTAGELLQIEEIVRLALGDSVAVPA